MASARRVAPQSAVPAHDGPNGNKITDAIAEAVATAVSDALSKRDAKQESTGKIGDDIRKGLQDLKQQLHQAFENQQQLILNIAPTVFAELERPLARMAEYFEAESKTAALDDLRLSAERLTGAQTMDLGIVDAPNQQHSEERHINDAIPLDGPRPLAEVMELFATDCAATSLAKAETQEEHREQRISHPHMPSPLPSPRGPPPPDAQPPALPSPARDGNADAAEFSRGPLEQPRDQQPRFCVDEDARTTTSQHSLGGSQAITVGMRCEGRAANGKWWPVVITGINDDGTFSADVEDCHGTKWPTVYLKNIRFCEMSALNGRWRVSSVPHKQFAQQIGRQNTICDCRLTWDSHPDTVHNICHINGHYYLDKGTTYQGQIVSANSTTLVWRFGDYGDFHWTKMEASRKEADKVMITGPIRYARTEPENLEANTHGMWEGWPRKLRNLQFFVRSSTFDLCVAVLIVGNAVCTGLEVAAMASRLNEGVLTPLRPDGFVAAQLIFSCVFLIEVCLRVFAEAYASTSVDLDVTRRAPYWLFDHARQWRWIVLDIILVGTTFVQTTIDTHDTARAKEHGYTGQYTHRLPPVLSVFRLWRLFQLVNTVKELTHSVFFKELRLMVNCFFGVTRITCWLLLILSLVCFMFGACLSFGSLAITLHNGDTDSKHREHFGSMSDALLTLFQCISNGALWGGIYRSLEPLPISYRAIFLAFVFLISIVLMSCVSAIFVEAAKQKAKADNLTIHCERKIQKDAVKKNAHAVFSSLLRRKHDTTIVLRDLEKYEETSAMALFDRFGLELHEVADFFRMLDADNSNEVTAEEFTQGCLSLCSGSTAFSRAILEYRTNMLLQRVDELCIMLKKANATAVAGIGAPSAIEIVANAGSAGDSSLRAAAKQ